MRLYWVSNDIQSKLPFRLDEAALDSVVGKYKVGSILNAPQTTAQTPAMWNQVVKTIQDVSIKHLGIPTVYGLDQMHGTTYSTGGTLFPGAINMAATFNRDLVYKMGEIVAYETRACNVPWIYGPCIDLGRMQAWSRQYESFGEDVFLSSEMGAAALRGMQGDNPNHTSLPRGRLPKALLCLRSTIQRTGSFTGQIELRGTAREAVCALSAGNPGRSLKHHDQQFQRKWSEGHGQPGIYHRLAQGRAWLGRMVVTDWGDIDGAVTSDRVVPTAKEATG